MAEDEAPQADGEGDEVEEVETAPTGPRAIPRPDTGTIVLRRMVVHRVPRRRKGDETVMLNPSEAESPMSDEVRGFLTRKLQQTMNHAGHVVDRDPDQPNAETPTAVEGYLTGAGEQDLVATSTAVTQRLFAVQGGSSNDGVLIVVDCVIAGRDALAVMKVEHERGVQLEEIEDDEGNTTLDMNVLENLLLTENTKTFKSAVLYLDDGELLGLVSDEQQNDKNEVARFFLRHFLGMRFAHISSVLTERFLEEVVKHSNERITNLEARDRVVDAAKVTVQAAGDLDVREFVERYVPEEDQDDMEERLVKAGVPLQPFEKDTSRIKKPQVQRSEWSIDGIKVRGPAPQFKERVRSVRHDGKMGVFIEGDVDNIK